MSQISTGNYSLLKRAEQQTWTMIADQHKNLILFVAGCCLVLLVTIRRFWVRWQKIASTSFLPEDFLLAATVAALLTFAGLFMRAYVVIFINGGSFVDVRKYLFSASLIMDIVMTGVRMDFFFFFRRIYNRISANSRKFCVVFMVLSGLYLAACVVTRTLSFVEKSTFDDRTVRIGLWAGDIFLDLAILFTICNTINVLDAAQRRMASAPAIVEALRPCRPMALVAAITFVFPILRFKYLSAPPTSESAFAGEYLQGLLCSHAEACLFIFVACLPATRCLLFPALKYSQDDTRNLRYKLNSSASSTITSSSKRESAASMYRSVLRWALVVSKPDPAESSNSTSTNSFRTRTTRSDSNLAFSRGRGDSISSSTFAKDTKGDVSANDVPELPEVYRPQGL